MSNPGTTVERPARVEVGQRWFEEEGYTVIAVDAAPMPATGVCGPWVDNHLGVAPDFICCICEQRAVAHPGYAGPATGVAPMGVKANGWPAACLFCGDKNLPHYCEWACGACVGHESVSSLADARLAWKNGARDFPRHPTPPMTVNDLRHSPRRRCVLRHGRKAEPGGKRQCHFLRQLVPGHEPTRCGAGTTHERSPYCEAHIAEEMQRRDAANAKQPPPPGRFQQSRTGGFVGIVSLRDEGAK